MLRVYAAKQVGDLSYLVGDLSVLYDIIKYQRIKHSRNPELNPKTGKKSYYISLSRNLTAAALRNSKRWRYGVILDGNMLSNKYHIEPFSFTGFNLNRGSNLRVKYLVLYDDGSCKLNLVHWPTIDISRKTFDYIKNLILSQDDEFNRAHKLVVQEGGKRRVEGHLIVEKYLYNVQHGDSGRLLADAEDLPTEVKYQLTKGKSTNEYEERIWMSESEEYLDIRKCIKGIVMPKDEFDDFETDDNPDVSAIREALDEIRQNYTVTYY